LITPRRIDDQQLAERYLADQLTADERDELEQYYSDHPQMLKDLQAVAGIKLGLALLRDSGELQQLTALPRRTRWHLPLALTAALLVAVIGAGLLRSQTQTRSTAVMAAAISTLTNRSGTPLDILITYDLQRTRSDADLVITKPVVAGAIKLRLRDSLDPPPATYRIELLSIQVDDTRVTRATLDELTADDHGLLNVYLDPAALDLGSYELRLFKGAGTAHAAVGDFLLDIVAEGGDPSQATSAP
jgi:hypothetical protein